MRTVEAGTRQRVAILVACHDDGATIEEAVESLRREPDTERVVVYDGSTDSDTLRQLDAFAAEGMPVIHQENAGPAAAWMAGLAATTAPYVMPFSSDDVLLRGATTVLADALDADPESGFAYGDIVTFGLAHGYRPSVPVLCPWLITFTNCIPAYSLFRRSTLLEVGGWRSTVALEDLDLWMRLATHGIRGAYVAQRIYLYRRGAGGRFRHLSSHSETLYAELREHNAELFERRSAHRAASPAPAVLKRLIPLVDSLPGVPRLKKQQLAEALTLLFWSGGPRRTLRIVAEGIAFRARLLNLRRTTAR
jgi:glycosyltransferase involved in cell wall biosynthesis